MAGSRRTLLLTAVFASLALVTPAVQAATAPAGQPPARAGRNQVQSDLLWLMAGLQQVDREPKLKMTKKQAAEILAVLKPLVDHRILALAPPAARGSSGQGHPGTGPGAGGFQNLTPEQRAQSQKQRQAREAELRAAMAAIDKILSPKQVEFIDNLDFDPSPYVFLPQGLGRGDDQGTPPTATQRERLRTKAREALTRAAALLRKTYELLEKRAAGK